jgi:hypothetical protein
VILWATYLRKRGCPAAYRLAATLFFVCSGVLLMVGAVLIAVLYICASLIMYGSGRTAQIESLDADTPDSDWSSDEPDDDVELERYRAAYQTARQARERHSGP